MADERVEIEIVLDDGSVQKGFLNVQRQAKKSADKSESFFKSSFGRVASVAAGVGTALIAAVGTRAAISAAAEQEQAIQNLNTALRNNNSFSLEASRSIQEFATELQRTTQFGDEVVLQQVALARNFARTNEEAVALVDAAVDLSAATGLTLDSAVRNLGKTFSGLTGELGESLPAIRTLTAEQLKNGEAVQLISDLFGGTAAENVQTFSGRIAQLSNNFSDALEGIGQFITRLPITSRLLGAISNALADAAKFLKSFTNNTEGLANLNNSIVDFGKLFVEFVIAPLELGVNIGKIFVNGFIAGFSLLATVSASLGQAIVENIVGAFDFVLEKVQQVAQFIPGVGDTIVNSLQSARNGLQSFGDFASGIYESVGTKAAEVFQSSTDAVRSNFDNILNFDFSANSAEFIESFRVTAEQLEMVVKETNTNVAEGFNGTVVTVQDGFNLFAEGFTASLADLVKKADQGFKQIGASAVQGLGRTAASGFAQFGKALAQGENGFDAFAGALLQGFAQVAIQLGTQFILTGTAYAFSGIPNLQALAPQLIASGAALATFGGALTALGGSSAGGAGGSGEFGGADTSFASAGVANEDIGDDDVEQEVTKVAIDVSGQVLNPIEVGNQLADILNESFRSGGTRVETV